MPSLETLILFTGIAFFFGASPGPNFIFVLSQSISYGSNVGIISTIGIGTGGVLYAVAAALGLSTILITSPTIFTVIKYLGAVYLAYLGIKILMDKNYAKGFQKQANTHHQSYVNAYKQGLTTTLLNPKAGLYYISFIPQFVDISLGNAATQLLILGIIQAFAAVSVYIALSLISATVGNLIQHNATFRKTQQIMAGITFILLGISVL